MTKIIKKGYVMNLEGRLGYFAWPSVVRLKNGAYMTVASGYRMRHIDPFGRVTASYSLDGEVWTPAGVVADTGLDNRDAGALVLKSGKVLLTTFTSSIDTLLRAIPYFECDKEIARLVEEYVKLTPKAVFDENFGGLICESTDGVHFSKPRNIGIHTPHGPTQLKSGRIVYVGSRMGKDAPAGIWTTYSDDEGKTWSDFVEIPVPEGLEYLSWTEPHAIETKDNHLLVVIRVQSKELSPEGISLIPLTVYQCESFDGGLTFTEPKPLGIVGAPPHLCKTKDGKLVLVYGRREMPMGIRAKVSFDDGQTWGEEIILTDDASHIDLGYPCTVEREDGTLLTVYYQADKKGNNAAIKYLIWQI
jgi:hypothetical protein